MSAFHTEQIETPAGTYTVEFHTDYDAEQPYDDGFVLGVWGRIDRCNIETSDEIPAEIRDAIERETFSPAAIVRYLRLKGFKGVTLVGYNLDVISVPSVWPGRIYGVAWAPHDATNPSEYVKGQLKEWRAWAEGDVFGFIVKDPAGNEIESVWGYYGYEGQFDYVMSDAQDAAAYDANQRIDEASRVGAGFIGLV